MSESLSGHCLCGGVSYVIEGPRRPVWNCHCDRCRRWTGHFMAATNCEHDDLRLTADETLTWHHPADDPNVAYGFCRNCGGSLFWKVVEPPCGRAVRADTLHVDLCRHPGPSDRTAYRAHHLR